MSSLLDPEIKQRLWHDQWKTFVWKRPQEVYGGDRNFVLYDTPGATDVKQGRIGDCYFLASISAIAEHPDRIKKIFLTDQANAAGCYAVSLFINGEKRTIVVDDYFPYDNESQTWAFSQPSRT